MIVVEKFFPFIELKEISKHLYSIIFCREVWNFQCWFIFRSITYGLHNPVQLQGKHRNGPPNSLRCDDVLLKTTLDIYGWIYWLFDRKSSVSILNDKCNVQQRFRVYPFLPFYNFRFLHIYRIFIFYIFSTKM